MPDRPLVNPSPNLLQRLGLQDTPNPEFDARMNLAQQHMRQEMPNEMANANIQPTGLLTGIGNKLKGKSAGGTVVATTGPFGGINYDRNSLAAMGQNELEDTLAHELTHVRQLSTPGVNGAPPTLGIMQGFKNLGSMMFGGGGTATAEGVPQATKSFYSQRGYDPDYRASAAEMEGYNTESDRRNARGDIMRPGDDIQLFPPRKNTGVYTGPSPKVGVK